MKKSFVPYEKLSKKEKRRIDAERRAAWQFRPDTRVKQSAKLYSRKKKPRGGYDPESAVFVCFSL